MTLKDLLELGTGGRSTAIPGSVMVPVAVLAGVLAIVALQFLDVGGGLAAFLVIAVAAGTAVPVSVLVMRARDRRGR